MPEPRPAMMEPLEGRRLLSSATFYPSGSAAGHLIVRGTPNKPNTIVLRAVNNGTQFQVTHNGKTQTFNRAGVLRFYAFGGNKADTIRVDDLPARQFTFPIQIFGRGGNDTLTGGSGRDTVGGGAGDDLILGGYGEDRLTGDAGDDRVYGGFTRAVFNDGRDTLWGGDGDDLLVGGSWYDVMFGDAGSDRMFGGFEDDPTNRRGDASDDMFGDDGDDYLHAGAGGRNRMHGMAGNDTLVGAPGIDTLYGGAGDNDVSTGGGDDIAVRNGEWDRVYWLLGKIRPKAPTEPGAR
jgi:Ca2+-binding RTX toxin-like protein